MEKLLTLTSGQKEFNELLKQCLSENKEEYYLSQQYYEGNQWSVPGRITMSNKLAVDKFKKDKKYTGVVVNLIKDCVDTIKNLTGGVNGLDTNLSDVFSVNLEKLHDEIVENILLYGESYIGMMRTIDNKLGLHVMDNFKTIHNKIIIEGEAEKYVYQEYAIVDIIGKRGNGENIYQTVIYTIDFIRQYNDGILEIEVPNNIGFIPIFKIEGFDSYVEDLIDTQDMLNISLTQEFEINKYAGDPLTAIIGMEHNVDMDGKPITNDSLKIGAGELLLTGLNTDVKRIEGSGVTQQFLDAIDRYKKDIYRMGKLGSLKNDDLSGVTSGYAIQMKLLDTTSFVKKLRNNIKEGFKDMFNIISRNLGVELKLEYSDIFPVSNKDLLDELVILKDLGYSFEFISSKMGLSEEEIKKELDMKNVENNIV